MSKHNMVAHDGVRVMQAKCVSCIFRSGNLMHLQSGRVAGMVADCKKTGGAIPCHETLDKRWQAVCRGFFDGYANDIQLLQIAIRLGFIVEVRDE